MRERRLKLREAIEGRRQAKQRLADARRVLADAKLESAFCGRKFTEEREAYEAAMADFAGASRDLAQTATELDHALDQLLGQAGPSDLAERIRNLTGR